MVTFLQEVAPSPWSSSHVLAWIWRWCSSGRPRPLGPGWGL